MPHIINGITKYQFKVFVMRPPQQGKKNVYSDYEKIEVSYGSAGNFRAYGKLFRYAFRYRKDIFHVHNPGPYVLLLLRFVGVRRIVYSIRGTMFWEKPLQKHMRRFAWWMALSKNIKIVANSEYSRDVFIQNVSDRYPVEVVYNPVYNKRLETVAPIKSGEGIQIVYVGRLVKGKNLFRWLDMAFAINRKIPNTTFKIYGDGSLKQELIDYAQGLGVGDKVKFMGYMDDVVSAYAKADLMLFLSEHESFGNVVVESILCGTPVLASAIPSMREIFKNYPQFLIETGDGLEQEIISKIENLEQLKNLAQEAKVEFVQRFSLEEHISKIENIYKLLY